MFDNQVVCIWMAGGSHRGIPCSKHWSCMANIWLRGAWQQVEQVGHKGTMPLFAWAQYTSC